MITCPLEAAYSASTQVLQPGGCWEPFLICHLLVQAHALFTRQAGATYPCPELDFTGGFNKFYAAAFELEPAEDAIERRFGRAFDPFEIDETFITSMLALEELGATGNKVRMRRSKRQSRVRCCECAMCRVLSEAHARFTEI